MKKYIPILLIFFALTLSAQISKKTWQQIAEKEIVEVMENQKKAWNEGSIEGYMEGYWKSDSLRFVGKTAIQYGWNLTLDMYKKSFPGKDAMGTLKLKAVSLDFYSKSAAFMIGRWEIDRKDKVGGYFTLIWQKINGKWVITTDHTT